MTVPHLLLAAAPAPSPTDTVRQLDQTTVTPGLAGFLATFLLVVAAIGLFMLLTRSLRRTTRNAKAAGMPLSEPRRLGRPGASTAPGAASPEDALPDERGPDDAGPGPRA